MPERLRCIADHTQCRDRLLPPLPRVRDRGTPEEVDRLRVDQLLPDENTQCLEDVEVDAQTEPILRIFGLLLNVLARAAVKPADQSFGS